MKKIFSIMAVTAMVLLANTGFAQEKKKDTVKIGEGIDRTAKKAGNATASTASKAFSKVKDKTYKGKSGPQGQTIYIDKYAKYYYVDSKGRKIYLTEAELQDK